MDEDLDELLDEVEEKFCRNVSVRPLVSMELSKAASSWNGDDREKQHSATKPVHHSEGDTDDMDALIEELLNEDYSDCTQSKPPRGPNAETKPLSQSGGRKCCPVYLGGTSITNGIGTTMSQRSCDQLRCTSCDFRVLMFNDYVWDSSCDYLFLRNNVPDSQKLGSKLKRRQGARAYACQCSWFSARELVDLRDQLQLRWVCGKHQ
ncbi:cilia- and flagella-associated protein 418 [Lampris incognitus]|uniref:cilia- and flagella-associated protein 418 n=1 Tax=Lampris incognitus TaxID=2546036 RepID=UPI0024B4E8EA|nr:cilia- and flagella-associated protein 418 [Lampris incognitus]